MACDHYTAPDDMALLAELGFNAYRILGGMGASGARDGEFSRSQLDHYRRMIGTCRDHGLTPV